MKITVLLGSPHKDGTTAALAARFVKGAETKGHSVITADCGNMAVHPCMGCGCCESGSCVFDDDMTALLPELAAADCIVFVTPTYYFGISAQLKAVIDRFYSRNNDLMTEKRACLISACADTEEDTMAAIEENYRLICKYLGWKDAGRVLAFGAGAKEDLVEDILNEAYSLGSNL